MMRTEGAVVFTIEDDGPGIVPGDEEHIFTKFYQSESSHGMEGNGLGLALVRQIVEMSGGSVDVQNLEVGGCRFTVRLPLEQEKKGLPFRETALFTQLPKNRKNINNC